MMLAGYTKEELSKMDFSLLSNEDVQEAVRRKLAGMMNGVSIVKLTAVDANMRSDLIAGLASSFRWL